MEPTEQNPYTTPASQRHQAVPTTVPGIQGPYGSFRNNGGLMATLITLLVINVFLTLFSSGFLSFLQLQVYESDDYVLTDELTKLDQIVGLVSIGHLILYILLAIIFCVWMNRSCKNAWLLDAPHMKITPGWSVGYYFIPILSLWKPYVAMKEIRRASYGNDHDLGKTLPLWWTFWLLSNLIGQVIGRLSLGAETLEDYIMVSKIELINMPIELILSGLAMVLVLNITRAQKSRMAQWR